MFVLCCLVTFLFFFRLKNLWVIIWWLQWDSLECLSSWHARDGKSSAVLLDFQTYWPPITSTNVIILLTCWDQCVPSAFTSLICRSTRDSTSNDTELINTLLRWLDLCIVYACVFTNLCNLLLNYLFNENKSHAVVEWEVFSVALGSISNQFFHYSLRPGQHPYIHT